MKSSVSDLPTSGYYVYNRRDARIGLNDGCIVWWKHDGRGYTNHLENAGVFDEEFKQRSNRHAPDIVFVPVEEVHRKMQTRTYVWESYLDV